MWLHKVGEQFADKQWSNEYQLQQRFHQLASANEINVMWHSIFLPVGSNKREEKK